MNKTFQAEQIPSFVTLNEFCVTCSSMQGGFCTTVLFFSSIGSKKQNDAKIYDCMIWLKDTSFARFKTSRHCLQLGAAVCNQSFV